MVRTRGREALAEIDIADHLGSTGSRVVWRWVIDTFTLVHLAMPPQIGDNREMATAAIYFACKCCNKVSDVMGL